MSEYEIQFNNNQRQLLELATSHTVPQLTFFDVPESWKEGGMGCADLEDLGWTLSKAKRIMRTMYGFFSISERSYYADSRFSVHDAYWMPESLVFPIMAALDDGGLFVGRVDPKNIEILRAIHERTEELREKYTVRGHTKFTYKEIARLADTSQKKAKEGLMELSGLIGRIHTQFTKDLDEPDYDNPFVYTRAVTMRRWFAPRARKPQIEEVLG